MILHSEADDVIPFAESRELVRASGLPESALVVVGNDHRLAEPEPLKAMLEAYPCPSRPFPSGLMLRGGAARRGNGIPSETRSSTLCWTAKPLPTLVSPGGPVCRSEPGPKATDRTNCDQMDACSSMRSEDSRREERRVPQVRDIARRPAGGKRSTRPTSEGQGGDQRSRNRVQARECEDQIQKFKRANNAGVPVVERRPQHPVGFANPSKAE